MITKIIKCPKCKKNFEIKFDRKDLIENQREERDMGPNIEYSLSDSIFCPICNAELEIEVFEYPENCFDTTANEI